MKKVGFYAGSFSPFTRGHLGIVCEALNGYDKVIVGVGVNKEKPTVFPVDERCQMVKTSIEDLIIEYNYRNLSGAQFSIAEINAVKRLEKESDVLEVVGYDDFTVDCALRQGATALIRGERIVGDHDAEMQMAVFNKQLLKVRHAHLGMATIPVSHENLTYISSTVARLFCGMKEYIAAMNYVMPSVHAKMMEKYLHDRFVNLIQSDYVSEKMAEDSWNELVVCYKVDRYYHTLSHVAYCLNYLDILIKLKKIEPENQQALELAIFYHDFVNTGKEDDEVQSCGEMRSCCLKPETYLAVEDLIMATCHKQANPFKSLDEKIIHDLDLAILGDEDNYGRYAVNTRREYSSVDNVEYCRGRIEVLKKLLSKSQLFKLDYFFKNFEETARWNLKKELACWEYQSRY